MSRITRVEINEGEALVLLQRVKSVLTGLPVTVAEVSSVNVEFFKSPAATPGTEAFIDGPLDAATVFFDALQYGADNLLGDSGGYNAKYTLSPSTHELEGGHTYRVQWKSVIGIAEQIRLFDVVVGEVY